MKETKTVFITGACINTGVAIVKKFASEGWNVLFTGRDYERTKTAEKEYKTLFPSATIKGYVIDSINSDNTVDQESLKQLFDSFDKENIKIDCLVLNAANQGLNMKIFENPLEDFISVINTNVIWNYRLVELTASIMKKNGGGSVIFVNSNTAYRAIPDRIAYVTSKGAQLGMMRALALDLGKYNIRVNAVLPGMIKTDRWEKNPDFYHSLPSRFTPLKDVAVGEDIADGVWYFATSARNTTGAELVIDGGNTIQLYPIIENN